MLGRETRKLNERETSSLLEENDRESSVRTSGSCNFAELVSPLKRSVNLPGMSDLLTANVYFISVDLPEEERYAIRFYYFFYLFMREIKAEIR